MAYQANIPTGSVPLNQDYLNLKDNFSSLNTQFLVDHVPLTSTSGTPPNGYHTALHLVPQTPDPVGVFGYGELYSQTNNDGKDTTQQLFYQFRNSANTTTIKVPMTRNFAPVSAVDGYTFLPGGLILVWGQAAFTTSGGGTATVPFNFTFPNAVYNIQFTLARNGLPYVLTSQATVNATISSLTGFQFNGNSANSYIIFWTAIGS